MFETLFSYPAVVRRHREGPLAAEREAYLRGLIAKGMASGTVLRLARCCLLVARRVQAWPLDHCFDEDEIGNLASKRAVEVVDNGGATAKWPAE